MVQINFNPKNAPEEKTFALVPSGEYTVVITGTDQVSTKGGDGAMLKILMQIVDGALKGSMISENLNLMNPNETTVAIAEARLRSYCEATNVEVLSDTELLHNKPFRIKVAVVNDDVKNAAKGKQCYGDQNRIKKVSPLTPTGTTAAVAGTPAGAPLVRKSVGW